MPSKVRAAIQYKALLEDLRRKGVLDHDAAIRSRVTRIAAGLIVQGESLKPASEAWPGEVHTTGESEQEASSLAGGKLLLGTVYVKALNLSDGELATMIAHDIAHAIAEHQREEVSQVFFLNQASIPLTLETAMTRLETNLALQIQLSGLLKTQEAEADQRGMRIAHGAVGRQQAF